MDPLEPRVGDRPHVTTLVCEHSYHTACLAHWERKLRGQRRSARCAICQQEYGPPPTPPSTPNAADGSVRIEMDGLEAATIDGWYGWTAEGVRDAAYAVMTVAVLFATTVATWAFTSRQ